MGARYRKSELATDIEIKEIGSGVLRKIELGAYENEVREFNGEEVATEITAGRPRLICGSRELEDTAMLTELPPK